MSSTLSGTTGNDAATISAPAFYDGLAGDDSLRATTIDAHTLFGNDGNDTIAGGEGQDSLDGGAGTDWLTYADKTVAVSVNLTGDIYPSNVVIPFPSGAVAPLASGSPPYLFGYNVDTLAGFEAVITGSGNDTIVGSSQSETLASGAGNDWIIGDNGPDSLDGGSGQDTLDYGALRYTPGQGATIGVTVDLGLGRGFGGDADGDSLAGFEHLRGTSFADSLMGSSGADVIVGNGGADTVNGGAGADTLSGGGMVSYATDTSGVTVSLVTQTTLVITVSGGDAQGDSLRDFVSVQGGSGNDSLAGNERVDPYYGFSGDNTLDGMVGNDTIDGGISADSLAGGTGTDLLSYANDTLGVTMNLATGVGVAFPAVSDSRNGFLTFVRPPSYADGDTVSGFEMVLAGSGNDSLLGASISETLLGAAGDDTLAGAAGADSLDGGAGNDLLSYATATAAIALDIAAGRGFGGDALGDSFAGFERYEGGAGADSLSGSTAAEILAGLAGNDTLDGGAGDDTLAPGDGDNRLLGGTGTDVADYAALAPTQLAFTRPGNGDITLTHPGGVDLLLGIEALLTSAGLVTFDDTAKFFGSIDPTTATVTYAPATAYTGPVAGLQNQLLGGAGNKVILGTAANDFINAGPGTDAVDGGAGNDVIDGGTGSNFLTGGRGADTFFLDVRAAASAPPTWSTITDWQPGEQLSVFGFKPGVSTFFFAPSDGAAGYKGVTMHADLDGNGVIDTSVTWTDLTQASLPAPVQFDGLLWFIG